MKWIEEVMKRAWDEIKYDNRVYDQYNRKQARNIRTHAVKYMAPFNTNEAETERKDYVTEETKLQIEPE